MISGRFDKMQLIIDHQPKPRDRQALQLYLPLVLLSLADRSLRPQAELYMHKRRPLAGTGTKTKPLNVSMDVTDFYATRFFRFPEFVGVC
jgi:hypothetical protein